MTISSRRTSVALRHVLLEGMLTLAPIGLAAAWQTPPPAPVVILQPSSSPAQQFQQTVQQQQLNNQLRQSQLQQQLQQDVSSTAQRPFAGNPQAVQQARQADQARQNQARAHQQDLLQRAQNAAALPRVIPQPFPVPARSGG